MKRMTVFFIGTLLLAILILSGAIFFLGLFRTHPALSNGDIPQESSLSLFEESNFRQGPNQCGPYAAAAFLQSLGKEVIPQDIVEKLPWKLPLGYTHPRALESLIEKHGVETTAYDVGNLSDEERIHFLKQILAKGSPVILLTYMYGYQHYIVLLGYNEESFAIYDPVFTRGANGMTVDENGNLPGNRMLTYEELLSAWAEGGIAGFYTWYALVSETP